VKSEASLFVYGTLRDPKLVEQLTGQSYRSQPALLRGYRKVSPPGSYAYIVADAAQCVEGLLLLGIDATALAAVDHYEGEGELYRRTVVEVIVLGQPRAAMTYVGIPKAHPEAPNTDDR
jgi:gamma-glutamylcyclotransferase (GGCT)/AIG2-like uncharacterized protein YtfP